MRSPLHKISELHSELQTELSETPLWLKVSCYVGSVIGIENDQSLSSSDRSSGGRILMFAGVAVLFKIADNKRTSRRSEVMDRAMTQDELVEAYAYWQS